MSKSHKVGWDEASFGKW